MLEKVEYYKRLMAEKSVDQVVGNTRVFLDGNCNCAETNLADLITDSFIRVVSNDNSSRNISAQKSQLNVLLKRDCFRDM